MALRLRARQPTPTTTCLEPEQEFSAIQRSLIEPAAFDPLYACYADAIYRHCFRSLGQREAAEDACAAVFRRAWEYRTSFRPGSFKSWLFKIADNELVDIVRAAKPSYSLDEALYRPDREPGPEERALVSMDRAWLNDAIAELPDEWQRVVRLRSAGWSCAEVAAILGNGRNAAWVRQAHHRALEELQRRHNERFGEGGGR